MIQKSCWNKYVISEVTEYIRVKPIQMLKWLNVKAKTLMPYFTDKLQSIFRYGQEKELERERKKLTISTPRNDFQHMAHIGVK